MDGFCNIVPYRCAWRHALAVVLGALSGCGAAADRPVGALEDTPRIVVFDADGYEVALPAPVERIVSLVPSVTETLLAIGAGHRLIARTRYDIDPRLVDLPNLGGGLDPSIERIVALAPDLVVGWRSSDVRSFRARLEVAGISLYAAWIPDTAAVFRVLSDMGVATGLEVAADSVAANLRESLAELVQRARARSTPTVLYLLPGDPPRTAGPDTFIAELIGVAGGVTAMPDIAAGWPLVSIEAVLDSEPDVILVGAEDAAMSRAALAADPGWRTLAAVRGGRVIVLSPEVLNRPGPGLAEAAAALAAELDGVWP